MLLKSIFNETFNKAGRFTDYKCSFRKKGGTMGKKDVISKIYLGAADRIADLLNNELFEGGSVVAASDIMELDSTAASIASMYKGTIRSIKG